MEETQRGNEKIRFQADDDFDSYEDFEEYLIHCIHTSGYPKKEIAHHLGYKQAAFSLRLNQIDTGNFPRFNVKDLALYMGYFKDFRPIRYLEYMEKKMMKKQGNGLAERLAKIGKELSEVYRIFRESKD